MNIISPSDPRVQRLEFADLCKAVTNAHATAARPPVNMAQAAAYARAGLSMHANAPLADLRTQLLYIKGNLANWRGTEATSWKGAANRLLAQWSDL